MTLDASADRRHRPEPGGRMRDSLFWQTTLPDEGLALQAYLFLTGNGSAGWQVSVWGPGVGGDGEVAERGFERVPETADLDDLDVVGLRVRHGEPLVSSSVTVDRPGLGLDLMFTAGHDAVSYHDSPDGLPDWFAIDRFEQGGRVTGTLRLGERSFDLDGPGHRDHSWGARDWRRPQHWKWFAAYSDRVSVNGWLWFADGRSGAAGFVARDGRAVPLAAVEQHPTVGSDLTPLWLDATLVDVEGGRTAVSLEPFATLELPDERNGVVITESATTATIDGEPAAGQWENEWPAEYLARARS